jgi:hypothetical protein
MLDDGEARTTDRTSLDAMFTLASATKLSLLCCFFSTLLTPFPGPTSTQRKLVVASLRGAVRPPMQGG